MDKSLLMFHGGVRSAVRKLADGNEHTLHFKAKTPSEVTAFLGAERRFTDDAAGDKARDKHRAAFICASLCDESGELLMTEAEAMLIPATLKPQLCQMVVDESNQPGEAGKGSPPGESSGSGTS